MFTLNPARAVYLHRDAIDFRKNINGLASLVEHALGMNAYANAVFVFGNRRKDRIKILGWDRNRFWLLKKAFGTCPPYLAKKRQRRYGTQRAATALAAGRN